MGRRREGIWSGLAGIDAETKFRTYGRLLGYWLKSDTPGLREKDEARYLETGWASPSLRLTASAQSIQENFRADVGFIPRPAVHKYYGSARLSVRPSWGWAPQVKEVTPGGWLAYYTGPDHQLETWNWNATLDIVLLDSTTLELVWRDQRETTTKPFRIGSRLSIPAGEYSFASWSARLRVNRAWRLAPNARIEHGTFWDGRLTSLMLDTAWFRGPGLSLNVSYRRDAVSLPRGREVLHLAGLGIAYARSTRAFGDLNLQYNSASGQVLVNGRVDIVHRPLSHVYISYNETRDVRTPRLLQRSLVLKMTLLQPL